MRRRSVTLENDGTVSVECVLSTADCTRMQRWSLLTEQERQAVKELAAEQTAASRRPASLWDVFDQLYPAT